VEFADNIESAYANQFEDGDLIDVHQSFDCIVRDINEELLLEKV
jgi:uncharacterized protein YktA (UPF0223 family)